MAEPTEADKREIVLKAYPGASWAIRVEKMSPAQITAIYLKLKSQGKL